MNLVEVAIVAAIVQFQDNENEESVSRCWRNGVSYTEMVDLGDEVITSVGLGQEDWE